MNKPEFNWFKALEVANDEDKLKAYLQSVVNTKYNDVDKNRTWQEFVSSRYPDYVLENLAGMWITCACGQACSSLERNERGVPLDIELFNLGKDFYENISDFYWYDAKETLFFVFLRWFSGCRIQYAAFQIRIRLFHYY